MALTRPQTVTIVVLRVLIGWHFLYEGLSKLTAESWSAVGYLNQAKGPFAGLFRWMASEPGVLNAVNLTNKWGLTAIGLGLIVGCLTRTASAAGMLAILMFYLCNPPFPGLSYSIPMEGSYLIVNKNLVEVAALAVIFTTGSGKEYGIDRILGALFGRGKRPAA